MFPYSECIDNETQNQQSNKNVTSCLFASWCPICFLWGLDNKCFQVKFCGDQGGSTVSDHHMKTVYGITPR